MAKTSVLLLGAFQLQHQEETLAHFRGTKVRALLAYLAVEADRPHTRSTLAGLLWPDQPQEQALRNLSQALVRVRQALGGSEHPLLVTRQTIQWRPDAAHVDVTEFVRLAGSADPAELEQAATLYRGELLAGFSLPDCEAFEEWLLLTRERLQHQAIAVLHQLGEAALAAGRWSEAVTAARRQLTLDPWREPAHRQLMRSLALGGDRAGALAAYARCCQVLGNDLDITPDDETRTLAEQIAAGELVAGPELPDLPLSVPRLHNLPAPLTSFVGREEELAWLSTLPQGDAARVVTVVGAGGSGKTRLALAAAWALCPQFRNGVWWVALAGVQPGDDPAVQRTTLASAVAAAMGIALDGRQSSLDELAAALHDRTALLVMDNCEHLTEVAAVSLGLLEAAPRLHLLATSREPLGLTGELLLRLDGLPVPEVGAPDPGDYPAVQLFLERAARHTPGWGQDVAEVEAAGRLCRLLEGSPLGIELAAHWVGHYTADEIGAAIQTDLDFLAARTRDVPERQRSLRAVFDYAWKLLTEEERQALARISIFRGSFDRAAAQAVTGVVATTLVRLVDKSLLRQTAVGRYGLHELLRQFAGEQLAAAGEVQVVGDRHLAHYLAVAEQAAVELSGPHQTAWLERLDRDLDNLRAALGWAREQGHAGRGLQLAVALDRFWRGRSYWSEARRWLEEGLDQEKGADLGLRAGALCSLGSIANEYGEHERAMHLLEEALSLFAIVGDDAGRARTLTRLGIATMLQGAYERATGLLEERLRLAAELGDLPECAVAARHLGTLAMVQGDVPAARERFEEALRLYRTRGNRHGVLMILINLADAADLEGKLEEAEAHSEEALALATELDSKKGIAYALADLGEVARRRGHHEQAAAQLRDSLLLGRELGDKNLVVIVVGNLAKLEAARGQAERAARLGGAEAGLREQWRIPVPPADRDSRMGTLGRARDKLGEQGFQKAWEDGRGMDLEKAMAYALDEETGERLQGVQAPGGSSIVPAQHSRSSADRM